MQGALWPLETDGIITEFNFTDGVGFQLLWSWGGQTFTPSFIYHSIYYVIKSSEFVVQFYLDLLFMHVYKAKLLQLIFSCAFPTLEQRRQGKEARKEGGITPITPTWDALLSRHASAWLYWISGSRSVTKTSSENFLTRTTNVLLGHTAVNSQIIVLRTVLGVCDRKTKHYKH